MTGNRNGDDRVLRRLRYAATIVAMVALGLLVVAYVVAYATRESTPPIDGPLVIVLVTALVALLGLKLPEIDLTGGGRQKKGDDE